MGKVNTDPGTDGFGRGASISSTDTPPNAVTDIGQPDSELSSLGGSEAAKPGGQGESAPPPTE